MNDQLDHFGIEFFSPSSLNQWIENPSSWIMRYLFKVKDDVFIPAMARGNAVEGGLQIYLATSDPVQAVTSALNLFEAAAQGLADDKTNKEREAVMPILHQAIKAMESYPGIKRCPKGFRVEWWPENLPIKVIGYADFETPVPDTNQNGFLDLKTTLRMWDKEKDTDGKETGRHVPSAAYKRQATLYHLARPDYKSGLLCCTPKASYAHWLTLEEFDQAETELRRAIRSIYSALKSKAPKEEILIQYPINAENFYWNEKTLSKALELTA